MQIVCAWCKKVTGEKEGEGISHTICRDCSIKHFDIDPMEKKPIMENPKKNPVVTTWHGTHKGISAHWIIVGNEKFGPFTTKAEAEKEAELFADVLKENSKLINKKNNNPKKNPKNETKLARETWDTSRYNDRVNVLIALDFTESDAIKFANKKYTFDSAPIWVQKALIGYYTKFKKKSRY